MIGKRKRHSPEFKVKIALLALKGEQGVNENASQHQIHPGQLTQWRKQTLEQLPDIFSNGSRRAAEAEARLGSYFRFYNRLRFHQALDYATPEEVYQGRLVGC